MPEYDNNLIILHIPKPRCSHCSGVQGHMVPVLPEQPHMVHSRSLYLPLAELATTMPNVVGRDFLVDAVSATHIHEVENCGSEAVVVCGCPVSGAVVPNQFHLGEGSIYPVLVICNLLSHFGDQVPEYLYI